jgi:hypothetical protein
MSLRVLLIRHRRIGLSLAVFLLCVALWVSTRLMLPRVKAPRDIVADARFAAAVADGGGVPNKCHGCLPTFRRYEPSSLETQWTSSARARANTLCESIIAEAPLWQRWLDVVAAAYAGTALPPVSVADASIWSTMTVSLGGIETVVKLEPLAGFLRDPRESCIDHGLTPLIAHFPDSKQHIFLDPTFYHKIAATLTDPKVRTADGTRTPRAFLFDVGSTRWQSKPESTGFTGLVWLVDAYARLGVNFDGIYAWEAVGKPARDYFNDMPIEIASRTHFYNFPVSDVGGGLNDVIAVLKAVALPGDFVVFKLDIDTEHLEERIVLRLLEEDTGKLVGDFYFEHHVDNAIMRDFGWGPVDLRDLHDSIALFAALRKHGIRSHSWP